jgi:NADP-dependent 3-hydroxy acid dehydrogenase YdfG
VNQNVFRDQVVIVTGASSGIGRSLALLLASQGAKVAIAARRAERLEIVAEECHQRGGETLVVPTDVSDETQCKNLIEKTVEVFGQLDMLVNNAGLAVIARLEDYSNLDLFKHTIDVNFYGAVYCTYHT